MRPIAAFIATVVAAVTPAAAEPGGDDPIGVAVPRLIHVDQTGGVTDEETVGFALQVAPLLRRTGWWRHATAGLRFSLVSGDTTDFSRTGGELGFYRDSPPTLRLIRFGAGAGALVEWWDVFRDSETDARRDGAGLALGLFLRGAIRVWRLELGLRIDVGRVVGDGEPLPINGGFSSYAVELGFALF